MPDSIQRGVALLLGIASAPLVLALAVLVRLEGRGPVFHIARRVGEDGRIFGLLKLRTMQIDASEGLAISTKDDRRITRVGRLLRTVRLDELPQLWNVVRGQMRLVGPRPEDPRFVDEREELHRIVFHSRPGITGATQLLFIDEASCLDPSDPEASYRRAVLPAKLAIDAAYLERRSMTLDLWILLETILAILGSPPQRAEVASRLGLEVEAVKPPLLDRPPAQADTPSTTS